MTFRSSIMSSARQRDGVEVCYRGDDLSKIRVVMNHTGEERRYGDAVLAPYESRIDRV